MFLLLGCTPDSAEISTAKEAEFRAISIDKPVENVSFTELLTIKSIIPLEYGESSVLQSVDAVFMQKSQVFVWDKARASLNVFSDKGKFLGKIGKVGKGPGEFLDIGDIHVEETTDEILLYSVLGRKLIRYASTGQFKEEESLPFAGYYFIKLSEDRYGFYLNYRFGALSGKNNLLITDQSFNVVEKHLSMTYEPKGSFSDTGFLTETDASSQGGLVAEAFSDTIFYFDETSITPRYVLDFGVEREAISLDDVEKLFTVRADEGHLMTPFKEDHQAFTFRYMYKNRLQSAIWLREQQVLLTKESFTHSNLLLHLFPPKGRTQEGLYIGTIVPSWYYSNIPNDDPDFLPFLQANYPQLYEASKDLDGSENPILVLYEIHPEAAEAALNQE
jgi:hypothetical protein